MKKILIAFMLLAGAASGQTYNVSVTNSLLGPVDLLFTDTVVTVSGDVVLTGSVFNASVTNTFSPQNDIFVTNEVTVGGTTVNNTNTFISYITNDIDVAGVVITNIIQFVTETNNFVITGAVTSVNSVTGDVTLTVINTTNDAGIAAWNGTELQIGTNLPAVGGGGLTFWQDTNGAAAQVGSFLFPTQNMAATTMGLFIGTNNSLSLHRPDGTASGGNARSPNSVDLQVERLSAAHVAGGTERNTLIGTSRATISGGEGHVILGGDDVATGPAITTGNGHSIIGTKYAVINSSGTANALIGGGGVGQNLISGNYSDSVIVGGALNTINNANNTIIAGGYGNTVQGSGNAQGSAIYSSRQSLLYPKSTAVPNVIVGGYLAVITNAQGSIAFSKSTIKHDGVFMYSDTPQSSASASSVVFYASNGFGINTNNPQESLHVDGKIQILDVKIYASGTNLYLTDGATYTNLITTTPL